MTKSVNKIFEAFCEANPNPKTELNYVNEYTLLVAVVLSAQSTDVGVNKATKNLFTSVNSPEKMLILGEEGLISYIKTIGLYKTKAKNIIAMSKILISEHSSIVPNNFNQLIKLPGVGRKTANVVLNCLFGAPTLAVDTHVFRVARRLGLSHDNTPEKVENDLLKIIPKKWLNNAHHHLILHGRYVCKARKPLCSSCHISNFCPAKNINI
jgi:endonuclease-3